MKIFKTIKENVKFGSQQWFKEFKLIKNIYNGSYPILEDQFTLSLLERSFMILLVSIRSFSLSHLTDFTRKYKTRSQLSELYVIFWFLILCIIFYYYSIFNSIIFTILVCYRIIQGVNYRLCILFVDRYKKNWGLRSLNRSLILLIINYFEIVIGFSYLFLITKSIGYCPTQIITSRLDAFYFSIVTITTLGFGDISPINRIGRFLALSETILGILLIVLVIGSFLTGVKNIKQLEKSYETHNGDIN